VATAKAAVGGTPGRNFDVEGANIVQRKHGVPLSVLGLLMVESRNAFN
jgi:hypothetical protein